MFGSGMISRPASVTGKVAEEDIKQRQGGDQPETKGTVEVWGE